MVARRLKVYGWNSFVRGVQVHCIVAATSWKEVARISGDSLSYLTKYGSVTGNAQDIELATSKPGTVFGVSCRARSNEPYQELSALHSTKAQYEERIAGYIAKGVSGGKDNPPDRYALVQLNGNTESDYNAINFLADQGFRFVTSLPFNYVLMGNYKENK